MHLTNDAVQRQYGHYNSFEDHNKLDLSCLQTAINRQGLEINVQQDIVPQMKAAAAFVFGATLPCLNGEKLQSCFEILGLDFMVNTSGKVCAGVEVMLRHLILHSLELAGLLD